MEIESYFMLQIVSLIILSLLPVALSQNSAASPENKSDESVRVKRAGFSLITGALQVSHCHSRQQHPIFNILTFPRTYRRVLSVRQRLLQPEVAHSPRALQDRPLQDLHHLVMTPTAIPTVMKTSKNHIT